jgi:hypothetical protein
LKIIILKYKNIFKKIQQQKKYHKTTKIPSSLKDYKLNLSISLSFRKENNNDFNSNGEWNWIKEQFLNRKQLKVVSWFDTNLFQFRVVKF